MYILLTEQNTVAEIIPDEDPALPGIPIEQRYAADFIARLIHVPNDVETAQNWIYDSEMERFAPPPEPVELPPEPEPEPVPVSPTTLDKLAMAYQEGVNEA